MPSPLEIQIRTEYVPAQSSVLEQRYFFAYWVTLCNKSYIPLRLVARAWLVTDANGLEQHLEGAGVVGEQPLIMPQGKFSYQSCVLLKTPVGSMQGQYQLKTPDGNLITQPIPAFSLADAMLLH